MKSRSAIFRRRQRLEARIADQIQLFQLEVQLQNSIDPESGMTLNLVEVDAGFSFLKDVLTLENFKTPAEALQVMKIHLQSQFQMKGAALVALSLRQEPAGPTWEWRKASDSLISKRLAFPARIEIGSAAIRVGEAAVLLSNESSDENTKMWDIHIPSEKDLLVQLENLYPGAIEWTFRDSKTGHSWRKVR